KPRWYPARFFVPSTLGRCPEMRLSVGAERNLHATILVAALQQRIFFRDIGGGTHTAHAPISGAHGDGGAITGDIDHGLAIGGAGNARTAAYRFGFGLSDIGVAVGIAIVQLAGRDRHGAPRTGRSGLPAHGPAHQPEGVADRDAERG